MADDQELELKSEDSYEIVPMTPIRKMERKIAQLETKHSGSDFERFLDKVVDMVEMNQRMVADVVQSNQALREDLGVMIGKLDILSTKISDFVEIIREAGEAEVEGTISKDVVDSVVAPLVDKMENINSKNSELNANMVTLLDNIDKRLKRLNVSGMQAGPTPPTPSSILARRKDVGSDIQ